MKILQQNKKNPKIPTNLYQVNVYDVIENDWLELDLVDIGKPI